MAVQVNPNKIRELKTSESDVKSACIALLELKRIFFWRNNTGAVPAEYKGKKRFIRYGVPGMPDIMACIDGRMVGIELKSPIGKQSDDQRNFEYGLTAAKGIYRVVRSVDELERFLLELKTSKYP